MHPNVPLVLRLLASSHSISQKAGSIIRDIMHSGQLNIVDKGFNDLQTEADRSSQRCIIRSLMNQFPKVSIIGEENLEKKDYDVPSDWIVDRLEESVLSHRCPDELQNVQDEDVVVWVDPLDGTSEFTQGLLDHVTILIGLSVKGKAIGGVIHQPFFNHNKAEEQSNLGRTIWGLMGLGAFGVQKVSPPVGKLIVTTTRSHSNDLINKSVEALSPDSVLRVGGAGNKVLQVIEGKAHVYAFASRGCKKWDTCAPEGILHALGGQLTDILGNSLTYIKNENFTNELGVLASHSAANHLEYQSKIPAEVKERLFAKSQSCF
ncbi:PREDICTED: 3'(2'),5'-bisphosphate nucleotidase 1-like [Rhagoletis zephyria]|uniref:3'(2'),5'-bisphosphate nucleotidase 1-like n=1 Tax=Rhagoletis zephyria TaxID=28612 RepID=UPI0008116815|nr:PREDICTED: 3'(2'),5'-bisphosphate nucleotidase 1-like [Rhagoletis zephyria]